MGKLELYRQKVGAQLSAAKRNAETDSLIKSGITAAAAFALGAAQKKTGSTNVVPIAIGAGVAGRLFTTGYTRVASSAVSDAGLAIMAFQYGLSVD